MRRVECSELTSLRGFRYFVWFLLKVGRVGELVCVCVCVQTCCVFGGLGSW